MRLLMAGAAAGPLYLLGLLTTGPGGLFPVAAGLLTLALAVGLRNGRGAVLVGLWGVGMIGAGVFRADPAGAAVVTVPGMLHELYGLIGAAALVAAVLRRSDEGSRLWRWYSIGTVAVFAAAFLLAVAVETITAEIATLTAWAWVTVLAVRAVQSRYSATGGAGAGPSTVSQRL